MTGEQLKSTSISNLDGDTYGVITTPTSGSGAGGRLQQKQDTVNVTLVGLTSTSSTYKMVRLPANARLKKLTGFCSVALDTSTGLTLDVGAYYSDSTTDGTPKALQGTAISVNCFAAISTAFQSSAGKASDVQLTNNGTYTPDLQALPLWKAVGLSADPGGYIDIVVAVHAAATSGAASTFGVRADYITDC